jgi:hypothetical protein
VKALKKSLAAQEAVSKRDEAVRGSAALEQARLQLNPQGPPDTVGSARLTVQGSQKAQTSGAGHELRYATSLVKPLLYRLSPC